MVKAGIKIFARIRPTKKATGVSRGDGKKASASVIHLVTLFQQYEVAEGEEGLDTLSFTLPRSESGGLVNNKRETYTFK